jgi:hypothetical protein
MQITGTSSRLWDWRPRQCGPQEIDQECGEFAFVEIATVFAGSSMCSSVFSLRAWAPSWNGVPRVGFVQHLLVLHQNQAALVSHALDGAGLHVAAHPQAFPVCLKSRLGQFGNGLTKRLRWRSIR